MQEIFEKITMFTTKPVVGQYRFKDRLQFYPSKRKPIIDGRLFYPLTLEMSFSHQDDHYFRYGFPNGTTELSKNTIELQHLLSVVTQFFFFGYIIPKSQIGKFSIKRCGKIETGHIRYYQDKAINDLNVKTLILPDFIDQILDSYYSLHGEAYITFRKACYLFYCGVELRGSKPSFSFVSFVSAIETLMVFGTTSSEKCGTCGQPRYRLNSKFRDFIVTFGYAGKESTSSKKFIDRLYSTRSKILHSGQLLLADMFWHSKNEKDIGPDWQESFLLKDLLSVTRICLINWLASVKSS